MPRSAILLYSRQSVSSRRARAGFSWMVVLAAAVFVWEWTRINGSPDIPYRGGFLFANVMVALVICGVTMAPASLPARVLSVAPLTFVGRISYGLYLWHWPIFLVLNEERTGLYGYSLFALRFAVTFGIAVLSWYLVETPVRQKRFGSWRSWAWVPVGAVTIVGVLFVTTVTTTNQAQKAFAAEQTSSGTSFFWSLCGTGDQQHPAQFVCWRRSGKFNRCRSRRGLTCGGLVPRSLRCGKVRHHAPCRRQRTWLPRHPRSGHRTHAHRHTAMRCTPSAVPGSPCGSETEGRDRYTT